jgi:hypothetical protein
MSTREERSGEKGRQELEPVETTRSCGLGPSTTLVFDEKKKSPVKFLKKLIELSNFSENSGLYL